MSIRIAESSVKPGEASRRRRADLGGDRLGGRRFYRLIVAYIAAIFILGGSARGDVLSLVVLRPMAILLLALAIPTFTRTDFERYFWVFVGLGCAVLLTMLHLIPLPDAVWHALPGRRIVEEIDATAGLGRMMRPLSIAPRDTWNALYALAVPLALLLAIAQFDHERLKRLLPVFLGMGAVTCGFALLQAAVRDSAHLYLYRITTRDAPVGLFANRNHQALFLAILIPMMAVMAAEVRSYRVRRWLGPMLLTTAAVLFPLILITGSRAGLVLSVLALVSCFWLVPLGDLRAKARGWRPLRASILIAGVAAGFIAVAVIRGESVRRAVQSTLHGESRLEFWGPVLRAAWTYFPVGSGIGTFVPAYQVGEPNKLLAPEYLNHAHNDYLELAMTGGVPAVVGLMVIAFLLARAMMRAARADVTLSNVRFMRLGIVIILLVGLASFTDYPARVPSIACLLTVATTWLSMGSNRGAVGERRFLL